MPVVREMTQSLFIRETCRTLVSNPARSRPSNQFAAARGDLTAASGAVNDGETALDKAWAEYEVAVAHVPINNVDVIIT
jgi:hypothetical protein